MASDTEHGAIRRARIAPLLCAACIVGCRTPPAPPPAPAEPLAAQPVARAEPVRYTLELLDPDAPLVAIHVEARGDADGESEFTLDEGWAGLAESGKDLELVEARGAGDALASERVNSFTWRVRHAPGEALSLIFELGATAHAGSSGPPEYYLPILQPGLLQLLGAQALPAPTHLDFGATRPIALAWRGFAEAGWRTISSFGTGDLECERALDAFRHAVFLAGDLRLQEHDVHGSPLWLALHGAWPFTDEEFGALAARIVRLGREFFADFAQPFYLVSVIPVGRATPGSSSFGGTGLTDSFALFLTPGTTLAKSGGGGIPWLLAHELFHEWNGQAITLAQPEQLGYWFSEGFTNFYARRLLFRAGLIDEDEYLASWNQALASQASNPERHAPAERVREAFWTERAVGELPYQRGDLIALYVDHAIRTRSNGARSLDDLMRELVRRARAGAAPHTSESLCAVVGEFAGEAAAEAVRAWAVEGVEPELPADAAGTEYALAAADLPTFDTGFDHEATLKDGVLRGVRTGGPAERAGLADGMRLSGWSVNFGQVNQPIEVSVREGEATRKISFLPHGETVRGYRLERR